MMLRSEIIPPSITIVAITPPKSARQSGGRHGVDAHKAAGQPMRGRLGAPAHLPTPAEQCRWKSIEVDRDRS